MRTITRTTLQTLAANPERVDRLSRERLLALLAWSDANIGTEPVEPESFDYSDNTDEGLREILLIQLADDYYIRQRG